MNKFKYRIKIKTFENGRKEYFAQVKCFLFWKYIFEDGRAFLVEAFCQHSRDESFERIKNHYSCNAKAVNIEFESVLVTK